MMKNKKINKKNLSHLIKTAEAIKNIYIVLEKIIAISKVGFKLVCLLKDI